MLLLLSLSLPALAQRGRNPANQSSLNGTTYNSNRRPQNPHALPVQDCHQPMPQRVFLRELQIIDGIHQDVTRAVQVERVITDNCVTSYQTGQLLRRIPTFRHRLETAKLGWHYVFDPQNYHMVFEVLGSPRDVQELELYMNNHQFGPQQGRGRGRTGPGRRPQPAPHPHPHPHPQPGPSLVPGYNGPIGCPGPLMHQGQFSQALQSVRSRSFSDEMRMVANQMLRHNCLTTTQVRQLLDVFSFESDQLSIAKSAFQSTYDIGNYYQLSNVFSFSSSVRELNTFLDAQPALQGPPQGGGGMGPCTFPTLSPGEMNQIMTTAENQSFSSTRLTVMKQGVRNHCVTTDQVVRMVEVFTRDDDRLDMAKFCYEFTVDPQNYFQLNNAFTFSSTTREFDNWLNGR